MSKQLQRKSASPVSSDLLASQAEEALRREKFKNAIELLKQLVKREARPEWRNALADAYLGRAKALAAKGMFKEAEVVLGNAAAADGTVKEPLFLLHCLVRQGQFQKALAHALKYVGAGACPGSDEPELLEVTAALYLAFPVGLAVSEYDQSARATFIDAATAAREALKAWIEGKPADAVDPLLARIPMRSPFRAVRLIVKALLCAPDDPVKARRLLEGVAAGSPFAPLRFAVETALSAEPSKLVGRWSLAGAAQQSFAIEIAGGSAAGAQPLARLLEAERGGPAALFAFLLKQAASLPPAATRSACLNLLPRLPDRIGHFEKTFGVLPDVEKNRILALAAEANGRWRSAEKHWRAVAALFEQQGSRDAKLSAGVVFRHLAELARKEDTIEGEGYQSEPVTYYLKKSLAADPDCLPALIQLIDLLQNGQDKEWRALAEQAARRFPDESAILLRAIESAAAGKAYKRAAGFAQRLLALDPINRPARQRMIDLQIAHARKQMRANRPDLAWQELIAAAQWERAGCPNAALRINQGFVAWRLGDADAEARLREGVDVAGDEVTGWLHAALQEALLTTTPPSPVPIVHDELAEQVAAGAGKARHRRHRVGDGGRRCARRRQGDRRTGLAASLMVAEGDRHPLLAGGVSSGGRPAAARPSLRCAARLRGGRETARAGRAGLAILRDRRADQEQSGVDALWRDHGTGRNARQRQPSRRLSLAQPDPTVFRQRGRRSGVETARPPLGCLRGGKRRRRDGRNARNHPGECFSARRSAPHQGKRRRWRGQRPHRQARQTADRRHVAAPGPRRGGENLDRGGEERGALCLSASQPKGERIFERSVFHSWR